MDFSNESVTITTCTRKQPVSGASGGGQRPAYVRAQAEAGKVPAVPEPGAQTDHSTHESHEGKKSKNTDCACPPIPRLCSSEGHINHDLRSTSTTMPTIIVDGDINATYSTATTTLADLDAVYMIPELAVAVAALLGNLLVLIVFVRERRLRKLTNYYVVSLAVSDLLVALLGIPFAILAKVGLPADFQACLFTISLLVMLCTISIFNLVAVSVDRFWAILFPLEYAGFMSGRTAIGMIVGCWILGVLVGLLPLMGWHAPRPDNNRCFFVEVMDYNYLVFLYFATIVAPSIIMGFFYIRIYCVVVKQLRQISALSRRSQSRNQAANTKLLINKKEVNAARILFIIVLFFVLCWIPLYTMNTITAFCADCPIPPALLDAAIILSHANSAVNPLLYAYHLKDFRAAFKNFLLCRSPRPGGCGVVSISGSGRNHHICTVHLVQSNPGSPSMLASATTRRHYSSRLHHNHNSRVDTPRGQLDAETPIRNSLIRGSQAELLRHQSDVIGDDGKK